MVETAAVLEFRGVDKAFGRLKALTAFDLRLTEGAFAAVIGPAGSGKAALTHLALGMDRPDRGTVTFRGEDVRRLSSGARRAIGVVFEDSALELDQSVRANLRYAGALYGLRRDDAAERATSLLERFGLAGHGRDLVRSLGAFDRSKVEVVRAALHRPRLLVVNDVADGLEGTRARQLVDLVAALRKDEGMAVLWTTGRAAEGASADQVVLLQRGVTRFSGAPADLVAQQKAKDFRAAALTLIGEDDAG